MKFRGALAFVLSGLLMVQSAIGSVGGGCPHSAHATSASAHHMHHHQGAPEKADGKGCGCGCNCAGSCLHACHFAAIAPALSAITLTPETFYLIMQAGVKLASHNLPLLRPPAASA